MPRKCILVVEDDPAIRRGLVDALAFAGYDTREVGEGPAGLAAALGSDCDLLLLDLVLPDHTKARPRFQRAARLEGA